MNAIVDRFVELSDGRPVDVCQKNNLNIVTIWSDDKRHWIELSLSDSEIQKSDEELKDRFITPALWNLDNFTFPERQERLMAFRKRLVKSLE